ncbi:MAG TPA: Crp/Fnr family transcriptional regulator [Anaerolineales bacterium]|jgi:CRP-like cAMP-binding protein
MSKEDPAVRARLAEIPWFMELEQSHFDRLLSIASLRQVEAGERIFSESDEQDNLYILARGRVAIELHVPSRGRVRLATVEPLEVFGWSSVTPVVRLRTASASAVLPSELIAFPADRLRAACDADPTLGYVVMRRLANVIAARLMVTRLQLLDIFAHPSEGPTS